MEYAAGGVLLLYAVIVASSLAGRQVPLGQTVKMALAWIAIFAGGFLLFTLVDVDHVKQRVASELSGSAVVEASGEVRIPMRRDGHFWVEARLNGVPVDFLVDTGATVTTVDRDIAAAAGLRMLEGARAEVQTANGAVRVGVGRGDLRVGPIARDDLFVQVSDTKDVNVLGMNFLSKLGSWRVEGRDLVLTP